MSAGLPTIMARYIQVAMRRFLQLLTLMAMMVAPVAAPAAAMAPTPVAAECADMAMAMDGHEMPAAHHGQGEACCIAVPTAIDPPSAEVAAFAPVEHLAFVADDAPFRLGAGPKAEDPPPRPA